MTAVSIRTTAPTTKKQFSLDAFVAPMPSTIWSVISRAMREPRQNDCTVAPSCPFYLSTFNIAALENVDAGASGRVAALLSDLALRTVVLAPDETM